ncbi:MAG: LysM peptidoglycan-binding domain-containing protein [Dissulfurispiraceae bacterium]
MNKVLYPLLSLLFLLLLVPDGHATVHKVRKGETIQQIAIKFHVPSSVIKEQNNLHSDKLRAGTKLIIPASQEKRGHKEIASKQASPAVEQKSPDIGKDVYHTVRKGESLKKIAKKYSTSQQELKEINKLKSGKVKAGQGLLVRKVEPQTYTVKTGDTIAKISRKFNVSADKLKEINDLQNDSLKPGQQLVLAKKTDEIKNDGAAVSSISAYDPDKTSALASAKLQEVKELSASEDISHLSMTDRLILFAKKMLHMPYRFGGNGPLGVDCSAYVQKAYRFAGIDLPRSAREQYTVGETVNKEELSIGDLVFFRTYASFPSHVGIYLGNNLFIHASSKSRQVTIDSLDAPYYFKHFIGAKRLISEDNMNVSQMLSVDN